METASVILYMVCCATNGVGALHLTYCIASRNVDIGRWIRDNPYWLAVLCSLLGIAWLTGIIEGIVLLLNNGHNYKSVWLDGYEIRNPGKFGIIRQMLISAFFLCSFIFIKSKQHETANRNHRG